jgi:uncharacterized protein YcbK (DUF882 family)
MKTLKRRGFLGLGAAVLCGAGGLRARAAEGGHAAEGVRSLVLRNLHTGEDLEIAYRRGAAVVPAAMARIDVLLRDFRNGATHPIDPALMDTLTDLAAQRGVAPVFQVISGYRSPQTNQMLRSHSTGVASRSLHMEGRAIDVRLEGVACPDLAAQALGLARGGVGFYRASDFVHLDTGAFRTWRG